jgi:hypothetical protein
MDQFGGVAEFEVLCDLLHQVIHVFVDILWLNLALSCCWHYLLVEEKIGLLLLNCRHQTDTVLILKPVRGD